MPWRKGIRIWGLGAYEVSDDGNLLAFSTDVTGFRQYTLQVKDLRTGEMLPDRVERTISVEWAADGKTLFYTVEDDAKRPYRLYRHTLGAIDDVLVYEEADALFNLGANRSRSKAFLFVTSESSDTTEVRYLPSGTPESDLTVYRPREDKHRYYADHHGDQFFVRTDKDAKNFRIVSAPLDARNEWTEFIPHNPQITREDMDFFSAYAVVSERQDGLEQASGRGHGKPRGPSHHVPGASVHGLIGRKPGIRYPNGPVSLPIAGDAAVGL